MCDFDPIPVATVVMAVATVVNVIVACYQWRAARNSAETTRMIFEAGNRPYVGLESLVCIKNETEQSLSIFAVIKNFGTATAENCEFGWSLYISGSPLSGTGVPANTTSLFPGLAHHLRANIRQSYSQITSGMSSLEIVVSLSYTWQPQKSHIYKEKYRYEHSQNAFMGLGIIPSNGQAQ
jgi:hypothetical protein